MPSRDWLPEKKHCKNTTNLQVIQKQYIFSVWCPITIVASHWKFPLARRETCNCADLFWNFLHFSALEIPQRFKPLSKLIEKRFHRIDKSLVWLFLFPVESEIVVQTLIKCLKTCETVYGSNAADPQDLRSMQSEEFCQHLFGLIRFSL